MKCFVHASSRLLALATAILAASCFALAISAKAVPRTTHVADCAITLVRQGIPRYSIVVSPDAAPATRHAAAELDRFLLEIGAAGKNLAVKPDVKIFVGQSDQLARTMPNLKMPEVGDEGYIIRTSGKNVAILGGAPLGTLNGVYGLLGRYFGCRWFTSTVSRIPKRDVVALPTIDIRDAPAFRDWRHVHGFQMLQDQDLAARNRVNSTARGEAHGGQAPWAYAHTFHTLVQPESYFAEHPEYFALVGGKRNQAAQLCLSNPQVLDIVVQAILDDKGANASKKVFTVCPMDCQPWCECDECRKTDAREGGPGGTVHWFVNQVAERVAAKHPDVSIMGLAYMYYIDPPKTPMRPNVIIQLCVPSLVGGCGVHPVEECEVMQGFRELVEAWGRKSSRLWIWYYSTNFLDYFMPYPNLYAIRDNYQFYLRNKVTGVFMQGTYDDPSAEEELRSYLAARLMWNPMLDTDAVIDEFLRALYGKAAGPIKQYIKLMKSVADQPGVHMPNYILLHESSLFTPYIVAKADVLLDEAYRLADSPVIRDRVKYFRLNANYLKMKMAHGMIPSQPGRLDEATYDDMKRVVEAHRIKYTREGQVSISELFNTMNVVGEPLNRWWQLGPLPAVSENVSEVLAAPAPVFDLDKEFIGSDGKPAKWTRRHLEGKTLNFNADTPGRLLKDVVYAVAKVWSPEDMTTKLSMSTTCVGFQAFVNGKSAIQRAFASGMIIPDIWVETVELKKGVNVIMIQMRCTGGWQAMVRLDDPRGVLRNDY